jgi:hypothetical protein
MLHTKASCKIRSTSHKQWSKASSTTKHPIRVTPRLYSGSGCTKGRLAMQGYLVLLAARVVHEVAEAAGVAAGAARQLAEVLALALALQSNNY